ncbi:hypothetical protein PIB30_094137, partial [Stylosanthes scabra]|nr:hypothetical protein [Stylosanthes scabra]
MRALFFPPSLHFTPLSLLAYRLSSFTSQRFTHFLSVVQALALLHIALLRYICALLLFTSLRRATSAQLRHSVAVPCSTALPFSFVPSPYSKEKEEDKTTAKAKEASLPL